MNASNHISRFDHEGAISLTGILFLEHILYKHRIISHYLTPKKINEKSHVIKKASFFKSKQLLADKLTNIFFLTEAT